MNRTIKFRGKSIKDGKWYYGYFLVNQFGEHTICGKDFAVAVIPETVGQFTGLSDKTNKEIYEGGIVKDCRENPPVTNLYYQVGFKKGMFGMDCDPDLWWEDVEVAGNIYENKELLEGVK